MSNLINDWLEAQRINGGPHGFECIGIARMQQVWDAAQEDLRQQLAAAAPAACDQQDELEMRKEHSIQCARDKAVLRDKVLVLEEEAERLRFELSVTWNAALDAAKETTVRGLLSASEKEKAAHYTACKNISDAINALKVGGDGAEAVRARMKK